MFKFRNVVWLFLMISVVSGQQDNQLELGRLKTGTVVTFIRGEANEWGIEILDNSVPQFFLLKPVQIEIYTSEKDIRNFVVGYNSVHQISDKVEAHAEIADGEQVVFRVLDLWSLDGQVVSLRRKVQVTGDLPGGFNSSII